MKTILILLLGSLAAHAQLSVTVSPVNQAGQKTVIKLNLKNTFAEKIESARATAFLVDDQGKVVGQATRWVIGGTKDRPPLKPGKEATFNLVVERRGAKGEGQATPQLRAKVVFIRLVLEGGKSVDPNKNVQIQPGSQWLLIRARGRSQRGSPPRNTPWRFRPGSLLAGSRFVPNRSTSERRLPSVTCGRGA